MNTLTELNVDRRIQMLRAVIEALCWHVEGAVARVALSCKPKTTLLGRKR